LQYLATMQPVRKLCLYQPDPPTSATIELLLPPRRSPQDNFPDIWHHLAASTHLTALCLLGSFGLLLPPPFPGDLNSAPTQTDAMPERHVQKLKNDTGLDLEFFFGDSPDPTQVQPPQPHPPECSTRPRAMRSDRAAYAADAPRPEYIREGLYECRPSGWRG